MPEQSGPYWEEVGVLGVNLKCFFHPSGLPKEAETWMFLPIFLQLDIAKKYM